MHAALALAIVCGAAGGCVTTNAIVKVKEPSVPVLIGTAVADLLVVGLISTQIDGFSIGASIASSLAITAADVAVGCLFGACKPLNP